MTTGVDIIAAALQLGAVYSFINFGFVYLYRATGIISFAQGQLTMLGGFVAFFLMAHIGSGLGAVAAILVMGLLGAGCYYAFLRLLHGKHEMVKVIATFMMGIVIIQVSGLIWGTTSYELPLQVTQYVSILGGRLPIVTVIDVALALVLVLGAEHLFTKTNIGLQMRALADDEVLVGYRGLSVKRLTAGAWAIVFGSAVLAGIVYSQSAPINTGMWTVGLSAFPGAVIGGLDSLNGAFVGSMLVAFIVTVTSFFFQGPVGYIVTYALMVVSLLVLPYGVFGHHRAVRL